MKLTLRHIVKHFGPVRAVDDVSLDIADGELFFLLGPSGCGKTTLLRTVAGFTPPDSGSVLFDADDVTAMAPHKRNTGMVFQNYALWPHMTVAQNVGFGLTVPGRKTPAAERAARVDDMLRTVHIDTLAGKRPNQLSGGEQQRVALARALVIRPACLLLDEPLSNLDAKLRLEMRLEIKRIVKEAGVTTLYVTHDQKEALSMADRCAVMRRGRVEQVGRPDDLYKRPASRFVADFVGETNLIDGTLTARDGNTGAVRSACGQWQSAALTNEGRAGEAVTVSVRPEAVRLDPIPPGGSANAFSGTVEEVTYLGEAVQYRFRLAADTPLKAFELNPKRLLSAGTPGVRLWVAPEDVVVLARS
ncbi:MAG: ABC transporter ATP-binding protein [Kiritimatiellae bacterium]|nr:ABC transporter ATP-binding protein [Kiritimatiellia bacterium]